MSAVACPRHLSDAAFDTQASDRHAWAWTLAGLLALLTMPALKLELGVTFRVGQLALVAAFFALVLRDLLRREVAWGALLLLLGGGALLAGLSVLSPEPKVKQGTFLIKYLIIFPAAFYVGCRMASLVAARHWPRVLEGVLLFACLLAALIELQPIPALVHERPAHLSIGIKGTFWEQVEFGFFLGLFILVPMAMRLEWRLPPARRLALVGVYLLALICALASRNKTVWISMILAFMGAAFLYLGQGPWQQRTRAWAGRLALISLLLAGLLVAYNAWLPGPEKLITAEMLAHKWEAERGAALRSALALGAEAPLLGHGFGFVEAYYSTYPSDIVGLGSGVAQLFNAYLDMWVSAGLVGLVFLLGLLALSVRRRCLISLLIGGYLFVFCQFNPMAQLEFYYLFLGLAFALSRQTDEMTRKVIP